MRSQRVSPAAYGLVLGAITSLQFGAAIARTLFDDLGAAGTALTRLVFAAIALMLFWRPSLRGRTREAWTLVLAFGLTLGVMNLLIYEAIARIPLGAAITLEFVGPLVVAVVGSRRPRDVVWALLAAAGVVLLAGPSGDGLETTGVLFALAAGACWGVYIVVAARAGQVFEGGEGVALAMCVAALVPLGPGIASGGHHLLEPGLLAQGAAVALLSSAIPYSLETESLRRMPQGLFGVLMSVEPAVAALAGLVVLGQGLRAREVVAIGLVVAASIGASRAAARPVDPA